jgi:hypothetical protein
MFSDYRQFRCHGRDQAIADFGDGFDNSRLFRIIAEDFTQFRDRTIQRIFSNVCAIPQMFDQLLSRHGVARLTGKQHERFHHFSFEAFAAVLVRNPIQTRLHEPFANAKLIPERRFWADFLRHRFFLVNRLDVGILAEALAISQESRIQGQRAATWRTVRSVSSSTG